MLVSDLLWALVGGAVVGVLGKWLAPGDRDDVPLWVTVLSGVGGVLIGNTVYISIWSPTTPGLDWWRHIWQIAGAAILVTIAATVTGRRRR
jgi:uncharacterized membrane protein YeaQ/YmgE (transglycosylase-associated protein family)